MAFRYGPMDIADYVQQQGDIGRGRYADKLLGQAYSAAPEQRQSALAKLAGTDARMAMAADTAFTQRDNAVEDRQFAKDDRAQKSLAQEASYALSLPPEMRPQWWAGRRQAIAASNPALAALGTWEWDEEAGVPLLQQVAGAQGGAKIHSQRVLSDGRILNTYADGRTEVTEHVADRQSWFANNEGVDPYIVGENGNVRMVGPGSRPAPSPTGSYATATTPDGAADPTIAALPESEQIKAAQMAAAGQDFHVLGGRVIPGQSGGQTPPQAAPVAAGGDISRIPLDQYGGGTVGGNNPLRRPTTVKAGNAPPSGYRFRADGGLEFIPGGPADPANKPQPQDKPLPVGALRLQLEAEEALAGAEGVISELDGISGQLKDGSLNLGVFANLANKAKNFAGMSDEESRAFDAFQSTLERLRNESLRLNKGVQTEGDSQRAWNELVRNINDGKNVQEQIERIQRYNRRAVELQMLKKQQIEQNYRGKSDAAPEDDIEELLRMYGDDI